MRDLIILLIHAVATLMRVFRPGGVRAVVAESVLAQHQLLIINPSRRRAPNLPALDRIVAGFCSLWIRPRRLRRVAIVFKTSTFLGFHRAMVQRKYRLLFSPKQKSKPGPKGPTAELIRAVLDMKERNPSWGSPQIADQINHAFGTSINKDVVRRILAAYYRPQPGSDGPSWLTVLGHAKDSLWSLDLFRCESVLLRTHWVLVVMDHHTRRIIGFGIHAGVVNGEALCRMFKQAVRGVTTFPRYLSSDHDPLFQFHQWEANLGVLNIMEIKTVPDSLVASIHRKIDRDDTSRMPGPAIVLDGDGFGTEIRKLQRLLQRTPNALGFEGTNTGRESWIQRCALRTLPLAKTLSAYIRRQLPREHEFARDSYLNASPRFIFLKSARCGGVPRKS